MADDWTFDDSAVTELADELGPAAARADASAAFALVVIEGAALGAQLLVNDASGPVSIGQSASCTLRVTDRAVSRRHASIEHAGRRLRIADLRSTNGTFVDGVAIESAFLRGGEIVRLGSMALRVELAAPSPAPRSADPRRVRFASTVGASLEMQSVYALCDLLAESNVPVVIEGETGTGKEALAESIHAASRRASGPFVVLDCTSVPASLFEAELLGHERGAFTGATSTRKGCFELAHGGTLLIDEIGDLDLALQAKLLRVVETQRVRRVGGDHAQRVDVRILAATRRDLDREVQEGRFRDDLFHRLAVSRVELPPLRRRAGDVRVLATLFWSELGGAPSGPPGEVMQRWEDHEWPGNVRELRNAVARRIALGELAAPENARPSVAPRASSPTSSSGLPPRGAPAITLDSVLASSIATRMELGDARNRMVRVFERSYLEALFEACGGDADRVAAAAGIGRRYLNMIRARVREE